MRFAKILHTNLDNFFIFVFVLCLNINEFLKICIKYNYEVMLLF